MAILMIETLDGHGRVIQRDRFDMDVRDNVCIGRALDADVVLDDPHVAARHALLTLDPEGRPRVTDCGTLNGLAVDGRRHPGARAIPLPRGTLQVGRTRLRVRSSVAPLAAERPDPGTPVFAGRGAAFAAGTACGLIALYNVWLEAPPDFAPAGALALVGGGVLSAAWIAGWALLSRILGGDWRWSVHAAVFFGVVAGTFVAGLTLDIGAFAFGLPRPAGVAWLLPGAGVAAALYLHITQASALGRRVAAICAILVPMALGGTAYWASMRGLASDVDHIADELSLYPPVLRLRSAEPLENFLSASASLQGEADRGRRRVDAGEAAEP